MSRYKYTAQTKCNDKMVWTAKGADRMDVLRAGKGDLKAKVAGSPHAAIPAKVGLTPAAQSIRGRG